jgi:hypothetical protein
MDVMEWGLICGGMPPSNLLDTYTALGQRRRPSVRIIVARDSQSNQ